MIIGNMATYPGRESSSLSKAVSSLAPQVEVLNLCLNGFVHIPDWLSRFDNVNAFLPDRDYKDVGKFVVPPADNDDVFYVDDDIHYPRDYVQYSMEVREQYQSLEPIIGYHGVIYADVFDGTHTCRNVFSFKTRLPKNRVVNQLGTGTVHCKGWQAAPLSVMSGSQRFVDVRYANYAMEKGFPMICAAREAGWIKDLCTTSSLFEEFTKEWPESVVREVQTICGYGKLNIECIEQVESLCG